MTFMRAVPLLFAVVAALGLAGCASPIYRPYDGRTGYSEAEVQPGVYDVSFQGAQRTSTGRATELAKLRAAELASRRGKPYFRIAGRNVGHNTTVDVDRSYGSFGYGAGTRYGRGPDVGLGVGIGFGGGYPLVTYDVDSRPIVVMTVELLDAPADDAFETAAILREAIASGLVDADRLEVMPGASTRP